MRRNSLTPDQAKRLAVILRRARVKSGLSMRRVAVTAGFNVSTVAALEAGTILSPQPSTLKAIADVLRLDLSDLYAVTNWLPIPELPNLAPYMRAKYHDLPDTAIAEVEAFIAELRAKHDPTGPTGGEDEHP